MSRLAALGATTILLGLTAAATAQVAATYVDVSAARGIGAYDPPDGFGGGVAAADYDNDGDVDLFVPTDVSTPDLLYRNLGDGNYEEIGASAGLALLPRNRCALWFDYDGDADLDLLVANDEFTVPTTFRLYQQVADSEFQDVTAPAGLFKQLPSAGDPLSGRHRGGICAADFNNDGWLDLFCPMWNGKAHLFLNDRDGTFTDASVSSGVAQVWKWGHQGVAHDFDGDGWQDIYVAHDFTQNALWLNQRNGTFVDVAAAVGANNSMNDMGMSLGDFDNDGDADIYITNIYQDGFHNVLYRNDTAEGALSFTDVSDQAGVVDGGWGWGTTFVDADRDALLDIAATNGWHSGAWQTDTSKLYRNVGGTPPVFDNASAEVGFNDSLYGAALLSFDYDLDGDVDLLQSTMSGFLRLLENQPSGPGSERGWLMVRPRMDGPNHQAIGAVVLVRTGETRQMRIIRAGTSYLGQEPAEASFGLADADLVDEMTIEWPDGSTTVLSNVSRNQILQVNHGGFGDLNADGAVDLVDVPALTDCLTGPAPSGIIYADGCRAADFNGDGDVDLTEWSTFAERFAAE